MGKQQDKSIKEKNLIMDFHSESGAVFTQSIPEYYNYQFIPIALGVSIFELFRRMKSPDSRSINYLGAATFMIYLFHDNALIYKI